MVRSPLRRSTFAASAVALLLAATATGASIAPASADEEPVRAAGGPSASVPGLREFDLPNPLGAPNDVAAGPDGSVWVSVFNDKQILRVDRDGAVVATFQLTGGPTDLTVDKDGGVWASEYAAGSIAHVSASGVVAEIRLPTPNAFPSAVEAYGADVYFTESANHAFGRIRSGVLVEEFPLQDSVSPTDIRVTGDGVVWVTDPEAGAIWVSGLRGQDVRAFGPAGDMEAFTDVDAGAAVNSAYSSSRAATLLLAEKRADTLVDGRSRLTGVLSFRPKSQTWFVDAGTNSIGWKDPSGHGGEIVVSRPSAGLTGSAVTEGRYFWSVERSAGRLVRIDVLTTTSTDRVAGADRYETAAAIARTGYPSGAGVVFVASGENFPDALAAGPVAAHAHAPILLTQRAALPEATRRSLLELRPGRVVVVGGPVAVADTVAAAIASATGAKVDRIGGEDRFAVSRNLLASDLAPAAFTRVYLATGRNYPDALAATPVAVHTDGVILLVDGQGATLSGAESALLDDIARRPGAEAVVVGGTAAVTAELEQSVSRMLPSTRVGGADRFVVASALNREFFDRPGSGYLASARTFADALSGGALAGAQDRPLFLAETSCVPEVTAQAIADASLTSITLLGGRAALTDGVAAMATC